MRVVDYRRLIISCRFLVSSSQSFTKPLFILCLSTISIFIMKVPHPQPFRLLDKETIMRDGFVMYFDFKSTRRIDPSVVSSYMGFLWITNYRLYFQSQDGDFSTSIPLGMGLTVESVNYVLQDLDVVRIICFDFRSVGFGFHKTNASLKMNLLETMVLHLPFLSVASLSSRPL